MTNAHQFLNEIADDLRAAGRTPEITVTEESFGTFVWMYAPAPNWYDRTIALSARFSTRTNRWALGEMILGGTITSPQMVVKGRRSIRSAVHVYAR